MEQEINELHDALEQLKDEVHENNQILRMMRKEHRMANVGKILKVIIYAAILVGSIVILKPYIDNAKRIYSSVADQIETLEETTEKVDNVTDGVGGFFKGFQDELAEIGDFFADDKNTDEEVAEQGPEA